MSNHKTPTALLVSPDCGNGPFLWTRYGVPPGGNCCDASSPCGLHPLLTSLWRDFARWSTEFELAPREDDDFSRPVLMDWPSFHARGLELARRLKDEVGEIRVIYSKPIEDPLHAEHEHVESMAGGATKALPHWLGVPFRLCDRIVSGGQTGSDRAALDFAMEGDYSHGGWCPKGRKAED